MTARDRDDLAAQLFREARAERASPNVRERTLSAMLAADRKTEPRARVLAWRGPVVFAVVATAAAAGWVLIASRDDSRAPLALQAEPAPATSSSASAPPSAVPVTSVSTQPETKLAPLPSSRPRPSLADETAALDRARRELEGGNPTRAMELLDRYERGGAGNRMSAEATVLRIEALARGGRATEANALARRFIAENPGNPLIDRARAILSHSDHPKDAGANR